MNKGRKTTNVKTSLNDVIRTTTSNRHPPTERQPLFDYSAITPHLHLHPVKRSEEQQLQGVLQSLKEHHAQCKELLQRERGRYEWQFQQMQKVLSDEREEGLSFIDLQKEHIRQLFSNKRISLQNSYNQYQQRKQQWDFGEYLRREMNFEVQMIEVQLPDLSCFRQDISKYIIKPAGNLPPPDDYQLQPASPNPRTNSQGTQTDQDLDAQPITDDSDVEDLLCCEEDLGRRVSASSRRRRKYAVGRRDVIREEDEWEENSSVLSEN